MKKMKNTIFLYIKDKKMYAYLNIGETISYIIIRYIKVIHIWEYERSKLTLEIKLDMEIMYIFLSKYLKVNFKIF